MIRITKRKFVILLLFSIVIIAVIIGYHFYSSKSDKFQKPPVSVSVDAVHLRDWAPEFTVVGTVRALQGVDISAPVSGIVKSIRFKPGQSVKKDALLVTLDAVDLPAIVKDDKTTLAAEVRRHKRNQQLNVGETISKQAFDDSELALAQAESRYEKDKARLEQTRIKAPFAGKIGIPQVDKGEYVSAGQPLVTLQQLSSVYVDFYVPAKYAAAIQPNERITLMVDSVSTLIKGHVVAVDAKLDEQSHDLWMRAEVENAKQQLKPGMFGKVTLAVGADKPVLYIPKIAISYTPYGNSVYIIESGKAVQRYINDSERFDDFVIIEDGLKQGEQVVVAGQQNLSDGSVVSIKQ